MAIFTHCGLSIIDNGKKKVKWQVDEDLIFYNKGHISQRLKIAQKVAFNIATFTFWVDDKSSLKVTKMVNFGEFLKTWSLLSNSVTRHVSFNSTKIGGKCQNSNATFWVLCVQKVLPDRSLLKDNSWWKMPEFKNKKQHIEWTKVH